MICLLLEYTCFWKYFVLLFFITSWSQLNHHQQIKPGLLIRNSEWLPIKCTILAFKTFSDGQSRLSHNYIFTLWRKSVQHHRWYTYYKTSSCFFRHLISFLMVKTIKTRLKDYQKTLRNRTLPGQIDLSDCL